MTVNGKRKGKAGEREVVELWKRWFPGAKRGFQYRDGSEAADVIGIPYWCEVKRYMRLYPSIWAGAWNQAVQAMTLACGREHIPGLMEVVVIARENRTAWAVLTTASLLQDLGFNGPNDYFRHPNLVEGADLRKIEWSQFSELLDQQNGVTMQPKDLTISGVRVPDTDQFLIHLNGILVSLTGRSFRLLALLALARLNGRDGWLSAADCEGQNVEYMTKEVFRLKHEIWDKAPRESALTWQTWQIIENNRRGGYRLVIEPNAISILSHLVDDFGDADVQRALEQYQKRRTHAKRVVVSVN